MSKTKLMLGNNIDQLKKIPDNSIDSVVTDPPYGISFMGKKWDYDVPSVDLWKEVYRVLKPGGHVLSFGGTRTYHRMVVNIEDAGFEIRDQIQWIYGSGFPKSLNIGKAIQKMSGDIEIIGKAKGAGTPGSTYINGTYLKSEVDIIRIDNEWEGWGTGLKPANEPICVARKPISEDTIAKNVLKWGTGGINIDECRVSCDPILDKSQDRKMNHQSKAENWGMNPQGMTQVVNIELGRFPANIIFDEEAAKELDRQSGFSKTKCIAGSKDKTAGIFQDENGKQLSGHKVKMTPTTINDSGGSSRFFYQAKVSKQERNMGLDGFEEKIVDGHKISDNLDNLKYKPTITPRANIHPTVKPVQLMSYLVRLITPPNGIVLDPFMGSGSTGISSLLEGFRFCGMEMSEEYFLIAQSRIENYEMYRKFLKK
jgi:site-specific DNA-methyltransferase (adenine-specific)